MKTISVNSNLGRHYVRKYEFSNCESVRDAYGKPSSAKLNAEFSCMSQMNSESGRNYKVISSNCHSFTAAWQTKSGLRVETRCKSYLVVDK